MSKSSIIDNKNFGTVGDFLKEHITADSKVDVVSAYFTIYAYHYLKSQLSSIDSMRFLFGEPTFIKQVDDSDKAKRNFKIEFDRDEEELAIPLQTRLQQKHYAKECYQWLKDKVEIRSMVKPNFLHGKMYHIHQSCGIQKAVAGSSNFTVNGLGFGGAPNIELNTVIDSDRDREDLQKWFEMIWNDDSGIVEDVKDEVLKYISQLYAENSPEFIYYKTLFHIFENELNNPDEEKQTLNSQNLYDSEIWKALYEFQKVGVKGVINKILKHNGCILADSVGLGKTYEALAVIKYFEALNYRVLVLCPKKLSANWTVYQAKKNHILNPFQADRFDYSVMYHTDMGRITGRSEADGIPFENFNWAAYDLVVIDESHNFKGNPLEHINEDGTVKMNRSAWLLKKIIRDGGTTKVLMLSATPVNNSLKDLRNQISLITRGDDTALFESCGIRDISNSLKVAQTHFTNWADSKKNPNRKVKDLLERLDPSFFKLLDELTIARSRKQVTSVFGNDEIGQFPTRLKPISIYPEIDLMNRFPSYDQINEQILKYKLSLFNPSKYIKNDPIIRKKYEERSSVSIEAFTQADREFYLIGMMKTSFLKRLESSIKSFGISLDRTLHKIEELETKIKNFKNRQTKDSDVEYIDFEENDFDIEDEDWGELQVGKKLKFDLADLELDKWLRDLAKDKTALSDLYNNACAVTAERDEKLSELKKIILDKVQHPTNGNNRKILLFTAFSDTANYLYDSIVDYCQSLGLNIALVSGGNYKTTYGKADFEHILTNFSPISKHRADLLHADKDGEIDVLVATDCISEGQNLQDCDTVVNYDIHWNPVRIIQRFGRIDRLGSTNTEIKLINFWPTADFDNYINLKSRVEARMALSDVVATGDDDLLNMDQTQELVGDELKFRSKQLKRLQTEILDIEEIDDSVNLTDFSLEDFRTELLAYFNNNRSSLEHSPFGMYAIVPSPEHSPNSSRFNDEEKGLIQPGTIYCLKLRNPAVEGDKINPIAPYFLVYIREDLTVRYNYVNIKQILEIYRAICKGEKNPYYDLCDMFNLETSNCDNMDKYGKQINKAVKELLQLYKKKSTSRLSVDRGAILQPIKSQPTQMESFDLVTWLIIK